VEYQYYLRQIYRKDGSVWIDILEAAQAEKLLDSADKNCAPYLKHDTGQAFGVAENYYLCIDSGKPGIENAVKIIEASYHTLS